MCWEDHVDSGTLRYSVANVSHIASWNCCTMWIEIINLWDISLCMTDDFLLVKLIVRKLKFLNELVNYSGNFIRLRKILIK